ncbi:hypothetical protein OPT61_g10644 [Boeremia exigua]|uniref:Uncharacterized protein n=1 Tax=Boeremia exigua TaxID=749465 RepID=A0ACC2HNX2_9PLEO|nr:hypothetical protein OPT61_g10644 [Boeremia exigua]
MPDRDFTTATLVSSCGFPTFRMFSNKKRQIPLCELTLTLVVSVVDILRTYSPWPGTRCLLKWHHDSRPGLTFGAGNNTFCSVQSQKATEARYSMDAACFEWLVPVQHDHPVSQPARPRAAGMILLTMYRDHHNYYPSRMIDCRTERVQYLSEWPNPELRNAGLKCRLRRDTQEFKRAAEGSRHDDAHDISASQHGAAHRWLRFHAVSTMNECS